MTVVVPLAVTLKGALPPQVVEPSVEVPVTVMMKPVPAGSPPMTAVAFVLEETSIEPVLVKPPGPVIE